MRERPSPSNRLVDAVRAVARPRVQQAVRRYRARGSAAWDADPRWDRLRRSGLFDAGWYLRTYPRAAAWGPDPMRHWVQVGVHLGADPNAIFDTDWYLRTYPDVRAAGLNPLLHYLDHGAAEGRDPGPLFDTSYYLRHNPDVGWSGTNPLAHYLTAGEREARRPRGSRVAAAPDRTVRGGRRIVLVSGEPGTPGHRYRVERLAASAVRLGYDAAVLDVPQAASSRLAAVQDADVVVLWRTVWGPELATAVQAARRGGAVVVFDVDDLMVDPRAATVAVIDGIRSQGLTEDDVADWYTRMRRTAAQADVCTCTTDVLADHLRRLNRPVWVLPNGFDDDTLQRSRLARRVVDARPTAERVVRIGYAAGSRTHQRDFATVAPAVADVLRRHPEARLVLFRHAFDLDEFPVFDALRAQIEWRDIVALADLPAELARFDVNLAPLEVGNPFCEAKSALKFFEAALVDVPTVASPTEPFRQVVDSGRTGILAGTVGEWTEALDELVTDATLRRRLGTAARRSVLFEHGPQRHDLRVAALLEQLLHPGPRAAQAFAGELSRATLATPDIVLATDCAVEFEHDALGLADVTVVVPVFNYAHFLVDALDSVAAQTVERLDLVIVDDRSTDDSLAVARSWLDRHAHRFNRALLLRPAVNGGLASARNTGFDHAATPFVLPLDADNVLYPDCVSRLLDAITADRAAFAYPRIAQFGDRTWLSGRLDAMGYLPFEAQRLVAGNYIDAMALVRVSAWAAAGGYRQGVRGWEDYDLWCRLVEQGLFGVQVNESLAGYRVHGGSMLHTDTHADGRLTDVHRAMAAGHPWLRLVDFAVDAEPGFEPPAEIERSVPWSGPSAATPATGTEDVTGDVDPATGTEDAAGGVDPATGTEDVTGDVDPAGRAARLAALRPLLRCPVTGGQLTEVGTGWQAPGGPVWPLVAGRPLLFPGHQGPVFRDLAHVGNPLPERAQLLVRALDGWGLHLSGGGTTTGSERMVELDAAVFAPTDIVGDVHRLPFADGVFDLVVAMNAFEHYRDPVAAAAEIRRVLRPGGAVFLHTAFLQPVHEAPHHYFNTTRYGLQRWFDAFEVLDLVVSDNFHPGYTLSWLASEAEQVLDGNGPAFRATTMGQWADLWRDPARRAGSAGWSALAALRGADRERLAAGFELLARRPGGGDG